MYDYFRDGIDFNVKKNNRPPFGELFVGFDSAPDVA